MKKTTALLLAVTTLLALAACGGKPDTGTTAQSAPPASSSVPDAAAAPAPEAQNTSGEIRPAAEGKLTIGLENAAVVIHGTTVPMPYRLDDLFSAGVPVNGSCKDIELGAGDFFNLNLYLDEDHDHLLVPGYYNDGDTTIRMADAEAREIELIAYVHEPEDQDISILGVTLGMAKSEVIAMFGQPIYVEDDGEGIQWEVAMSDADYEGVLIVWLTDGTDSAVVSGVCLALREPIL